jgi:hypothetical protein
VSSLALSHETPSGTGERPEPMMRQDNDYVFKELLEIPEERYRRLLDEKVIY